MHERRRLDARRRLGPRVRGGGELALHRVDRARREPRRVLDARRVAHRLEARRVALLRRAERERRRRRRRRERGEEGAAVEELDARHGGRALVEEEELLLGREAARRRDVRRLEDVGVELGRRRPRARLNVLAAVDDERELEAARVGVGVDVGGGVLEEVPQLLLLGRERGVGGARLAQPEGVLVAPREEARHQQVEGRRERARREEAARRVHRVRVVAHVGQRREPALLAVLEPQVVGGGERLAGGGQEDEELRLRRLEHGRLREAAEERVELGLARLREPEAGLLLAVQPRRAAVVAVAEVGRRPRDEREPEPRQLDPRDRRRRRRRLGARLGARLGGGARARARARARLGGRRRRRLGRPDQDVRDRLEAAEDRHQRRDARVVGRDEHEGGAAAVDLGLLEGLRRPRVEERQPEDAAVRLVAGAAGAGPGVQRGAHPAERGAVGDPPSRPAADARERHVEARVADEEGARRRRLEAVERVVVVGLPEVELLEQRVGEEAAEEAARDVGLRAEARRQVARDAERRRRLRRRRADVAAQRGRPRAGGVGLEDDGGRRVERGVGVGGEDQAAVPDAARRLDREREDERRARRHHELAQHGRRRLLPLPRRGAQRGEADDVGVGGRLRRQRELARRRRRRRAARGGRAPTPRRRRGPTGAPRPRQRDRPRVGGPLEEVVARREERGRARARRWCGRRRTAAASPGPSARGWRRSRRARPSRAARAASGCA